MLQMKSRFALLLGVFSCVAGAAPQRDQLLAWKGQDQVQGYAHMDQVFSTKEIKRGASVRPLPFGKPLESVTYHFDAESGGIDEFMQRNRVAALLVVSHGKIVLEHYGLGQSARTRWTSFSVAKSVTSTLVGAAIRDGFIKSVNEPIAKYIPELAHSAYAEVTIAQLLEMRSGVAWNENYQDRNSDAWWLSQEFANDKGRLVEYMAARKRVAPAGSVFNYNTGETNLAGVLVGRAVGKPISRYLSEKIWSRAGMQSDAYWITTGGLEVGGCCISMPARDYARFGLFFMHGAKIGNEAVVPDGWVDEATNAYTKNIFADFGYGYFWWPRADHSYEAIGIHGQALFLDPKADLVVVTLSAWPTADWEEGYKRNGAFIEAVRSAVR